MPAPSPPPPSPVRQLLEQIHARFAGLDTGHVATYIPELAKADPAWFGIVVATVDGQVYEVGDTRQLFTLQSVSKPLVYGVALEDCGREGVERVVGVEPSGDAFNSISLEPGTGRPRNPMINAGAIAVASLVQGATQADRLRRVVDAVSAYAGRRLDIDETVYESERATGHRNRAIGHMLRNHDIIRDDPEPALSLYFKQCSLLVDGRDLALMAATLANGGVNPVTQQRAVARDHIDAILSVMTTCGMYDFSGEWVYRVGLPAKSGVGGGILAVLPGQLGIGVFSPLLDERGNSARGVRVCEALSRELGLHFLQPPRPASSGQRARYDGSQVRSRRQRLPEQARILSEHGHATRVYELQGDLRFATLEPVLRDIVDGGAGGAVGSTPGADAPRALRHAVLDFARVTHVDAAALGLLERLADTCAARGQQLLLTRVRRGGLLDGFGSGMDPRSARAVSFVPQLDVGLEWCERQLLAAHGDVPSAAATGPVPAVDLAAHSLCAGLVPADLQALDALLGTVQAEAGTLIVARGDVADRLFLLMAGEVSVLVHARPGGTRRLTTLGPGMGFGESALLDSGLRSADVRADTAVVCRTLGVDDFHRLGQERPRLALALMHNLLRLSASTAARLTGELAALGADVP